MSYVNLHTHIASIGDSVMPMDALVDRLKSNNQTAIAKTDHGTMILTPTFYTEMIANGIKPIIGIEGYIRNDISERTSDDRGRHIILLAENNTGYSNLVALTTIASTDGMYYKPSIDYKLLKEYRSGLIAMSACVQGDVGVALFKDIDRDSLSEDTNIPEQNIANAVKIARMYQNIMGSENFFLETQPVNTTLSRVMQRGIREVSRETGIPIVPTCDAHYPDPSYALAHKLMIAYSHKGKVYSNWAPEYWLRTDSEIIREGALPKELELTNQIAERCDVSLIPSDKLLPDIPHDAERQIIDQVDRFLRNIKRTLSEEWYRIYHDRAQYELEVLRQKNAIGYMWIVWDYVRYAGSEGLYVGPGRGSAAGSLIAYILGITKIDPVPHGLLFERFLNPGRARGTLPDIDIDFSEYGATKVQEYLAEKYGSDKTARIGTIGTFQTKKAIRYIGPYTQIPKDDIDKAAASIKGSEGEGNNKASIPISWLVENNRTINEIYSRGPEYKESFEAIDKIISVPSNLSSHACGVIVTPNPLETFIPLMQTKKGIATQYTGEEIVDILKTLKFDILVLTTIDLYLEMARLIGQDFDINDILKAEAGSQIILDREVRELLSNGSAKTLFQLSSKKGRDIIRDIAPRTLPDIAVSIALNRPAILNSKLDIEYIQRRRGDKPTTYWHDCFKPILQDTYGIIVYQDQALKIATDLAGYSWLEADKLRKIIGKKKVEIIEAEREKFVSGLRKMHPDISEETAKEVFENVKDFAGYGFNKCLSGDTEIYAYVSTQKDPIKKVSLYTIDEIRELMDAGYDIYALSSNFKLNKIMDIQYSDAEERIFTHDNNVIRCSADHRFMVASGDYKRISDIQNLNDLKRVNI